MLNSNQKPSQKYLKLPFHPANAGFDDVIGFGRSYKSSNGDSCYAGHKSFCWHPIRHPPFL